mmetsp:Transcript_4799/g.7259  ORF Transcript_4799/g.7259 Transcript_4799/m.7259 type:complete len:307 (-) Transcript_4799:97-1017(-)
MKLNIANPFTGSQKFMECDDEKKLRVLYDKKISQEVEGDDLGEEFKGYIFRISGGNDKQGFPMRQGVLCNHRVRLLLTKGSPCYRPRRKGEKKRKSVRGCIVGSDLAVLNLVVVKIGESDVPGLSEIVPRRVGPKRATKIKKLFNLSKTDDVRKYVIGIKKVDKKGKTYTKRPKIQRLITPMKKKHDNRLKTLKKRMIAKAKENAAEYGKLLAKRKKEALMARQSKLSKRRSSRRASRKVSTKGSIKKSSVRKASSTKISTDKKKSKTAMASKAKKDPKTNKVEKAKKVSKVKVAKASKKSDPKKS